MPEDKLKRDARRLDIETRVSSKNTSIVNFFGDKRLDPLRVLALGISQIDYTTGSSNCTRRFPLVVQMVECEKYDNTTQIDHYYFDRRGKILSHTYEKFECRTPRENTQDLSPQRLIQYKNEICELLNFPESLPEPLNEHPAIIKLKRGDLVF